MPARFQVQGSKFKVFKRSKFYEPFKNVQAVQNVQDVSTETGGGII